MKESRIKFDLEKSDQLNKYGMDNLNILYSSDKGNNYNKLIKIASGGEKSRILLAINVLFSDKMRLPTLIFDEIDSGTSGKVANVIGDLMKRIGCKSQIIAISHLAQVAAKASNHFKVYKILSSDKPKTLLRKLNHEERIKEIAAMISVWYRPNFSFCVERIWKFSCVDCIPIFIKVLIGHRKIIQTLCDISLWVCK